METVTVSIKLIKPGGLVSEAEIEDYVFDMCDMLAEKGYQMVSHVSVSDE